MGFCRVLYIRRKKGTKPFGKKKEKELIGFLKREFNIGYHVVEAK